MTTDKIPDDLRAKAEAIAGSSSNTSIQKAYIEPLIAVIAQALAAERERCAGLAEYWDDGEAIAAEIRSGEVPDEKRSPS